MTDLVKGRRIPWPEGLLQPGEYAFGPDGNWHAMTPNGHLANLAKHDVVEHDDGTITVSPSILVTVPGKSYSETDGKDVVALWHGFLERGVWRSC